LSKLFAPAPAPSCSIKKLSSPSIASENIILFFIVAAFVANNSIVPTLAFVAIVNELLGEVVPIPTFPLVCTLICSPPPARNRKYPQADVVLLNDCQAVPLASENNSKSTLEPDLIASSAFCAFAVPIPTLPGLVIRILSTASV